jgi:SEC-C motif-containing protein
MTNCYCGSGKEHAQCCKKYLDRLEPAPTAEALMRSRYCAFVLKDFEYLRETQDPQNFDPHLQAANEAWATAVEFQKLEVLKSEDAGNKATVEFKVTYQEKDEQKVHHEISRFRKQAGRWYYREGRYPKS